MTERLNGTIPAGVVVEPQADILETADAFVLTIDLPGARKEGIAVTLEENVLQVKASVEPLSGEEKTFLYRELRTSGYQRSFTLGEGVDRRSVDAEYADGVLTVKLFKTPESQPKTININ